MPGRIRIGTQGWAYDVWVGPFYPPGTRAADYLTVYARGFDTVEVGLGRAVADGEVRR